MKPLAFVVGGLFGFVLEAGEVTGGLAQREEGGGLVGEEVVGEAEFDELALVPCPCPTPQRLPKSSLNFYPPRLHFIF